ncbi:PREDICTED: zinc finger protein SNAI3 [Elephantulus edwardii]|uniref:zinc finger protein SNAI3 n=1 Tax=Elephantulus edwardii TaxID=28737 RepID=UPI0003F0A3AD|nr:PREDICTED: zinc finger protein SNAI3 [Elephantulus edwardii]
MPRSFLVKTHSSHRIPNYRQLETQREANGPCWTCGGLVVPLLPALDDTPQPQGCAPVISRLPLPRLHHGEAWTASSPVSPGVSLVDPEAGQVPSTPLRDSLNHPNLPPVLLLPKQWSLPPGPGQEEPDRPCGAVGTAQPPGCPECLRLPHPTTRLTAHRQLPRHLQMRRCFSCKHCTKEYSSLGALKMHLRTHTLPCICALCGKAFSRPWLLQGHIRTHTGEKPYTCPHCSRAFADRSNLRAHLQTHSDLKRYQCKVCTKTFARVCLLLRHEESGCCPGS